MFGTGDVIAFWSDEAGKRKYHLCISLDGHYVFLNSPKVTAYPGDYLVPCSDIPGVPATPSGMSVISCTLVMKKSDDDLKACQAKRLGVVKKTLLSDLAKFVMASQVLTEDEKEAFLHAAGDWA
jgi:hypothetical protein